MNGASQLDRKLGLLGAILVVVSAISLSYVIVAVFGGQGGWPLPGGNPTLLAGLVFFVTSVVGSTFLFQSLRGLAQLYKSEDTSRLATYGFTCSMIAVTFGCIFVYCIPAFPTLYLLFYPWEQQIYAVEFLALYTFFLIAHTFFMRSLSFLSKETCTRVISRKVLWFPYISLCVGVLLVPFLVFFPSVPFLPILGFLAALVLLSGWIPVTKWLFKLKIPADTVYKTYFSRINGGMLIAVSLVVSIVASIMGLFNVILTLPTQYQTGRMTITPVITFMTVPFTIPLVLTGTSFVVLTLRTLGEHFADNRITNNAIFGFICLAFCSAAAMISAIPARSIELTPVTPVTPPLTWFPGNWSILSDLQTDLFFSWPSLISLLLSSLFFARTLFLLSDRSRKRRIRSIAGLLVTGTTVIVAFSAANLVLRHSGYGRTTPVLNTQWYLDQILVWITLVGIGLILVAWIATSCALSSIARCPEQ